jgi:hypothetical protein
MAKITKIYSIFNVGSAECIHGSLLVVREMLLHTGDFMVPRFKGYYYSMK